jgi:outer membrane protein TolC
MKKISILLILSLTIKNLFAGTMERVLTEVSSVQTALSINPDILERLQYVEYAEQRVRESRALYFPNIDLNLNLSKSCPSESMIIISGESSQFLTYLPENRKDLYYSTRLSIWQSIYSGGRIKTINKLAQINMNKVKNEEDVIKGKVVNNVKIVFNECLYYKALLNFYDLKIKDVRQEKIYLAHNKLRNFMKKSIEAQFNYKKTFLNLLSAIGLELNTRADISGILSPKIKYFVLEKCILLAYLFKSEIKATQDQETIDGLMLNLLSMQKYPSISVGAARKWMGEKIIGDERDWYFSLNANIPIFDGGSSFARIKQGKAKVREATIRRAKLESEIRLNVRQSFLEYNFWKMQAINVKLLEKNGKYDETDIEIIRNLNRSYYNLELAVGAELDSY